MLGVDITQKFVDIRPRRNYYANCFAHVSEGISPGVSRLIPVPQTRLFLSCSCDVGSLIPLMVVVEKCNQFDGLTYILMANGGN